VVWRREAQQHAAQAAAARAAASQLYAACVRHRSPVSRPGRTRTGVAASPAPRTADRYTLWVRGCTARSWTDTSLGEPAQVGGQLGVEVVEVERLARAGGRRVGDIDRDDRGPLVVGDEEDVAGTESDGAHRLQLQGPTAMP
jgi:hypothetical protein